MIQVLRAEKGVALTLVTPAYDGEWSSQYVTSPAALDSEVSKDKGSFADCDNEFAEIDATGVCSLDLTATEMDADLVVVKATSTTEGVNFPLFVIHTYEDPFGTANTELASIPTGSAPLREMIQFLFTRFRNKHTVTADTLSIKKEDASTELGSATLADDGTTFSHGEVS